MVASLERLEAVAAWEEPLAQSAEEVLPVRVERKQAPGPVVALALERELALRKQVPGVRPEQAAV